MSHQVKKYLTTPYLPNVLISNGCNVILTYARRPISFNKKSDRKRERAILCLNRPFSNNGKTNFGKMFFKLLKKHFSKNLNLYEIFGKSKIR